MQNPAFGIEHFAVRKRERLLSPEERQQVQSVIDAGRRISAGRKGHLHMSSVWALDLLGLTGRRRNEIVTLKWEMVNWQHSFLDLPDTKGQLKVPVSAHVLGLLKHIHDQTGNPRAGYVLRGPKGTRIKSINRAPGRTSAPPPGSPTSACTTCGTRSSATRSCAAFRWPWALLARRVLIRGIRVQLVRQRRDP